MLLQRPARLRPRRATRSFRNPAPPRPVPVRGNAPLVSGRTLKIAHHGIFAALSRNPWISSPPLAPRKTCFRSIVAPHSQRPTEVFGRTSRFQTLKQRLAMLLRPPLRSEALGRRVHRQDAICPVPMPREFMGPVPARLVALRSKNALWEIMAEGVGDSRSMNCQSQPPSGEPSPAPTSGPIPLNFRLSKPTRLEPSATKRRPLRVNSTAL